MLADLAPALRERGFLAADEDPDVNITLVSSRVMNVAVFRRDDVFFHVRIKEQGALAEEFENYSRAWRAFPDFVPEPFAHFVSHGWEFIVIQGVPHRPLSRGKLAEHPGIVKQFTHFLTASTATKTKKTGHVSFLHDLLSRTDDRTCKAVVKRCMQLPELASLPHIPQHGDFVVNNCGRRTRGLVIFDWEDYGRINLPGFDLCTLIASDAVFGTQTLASVVRNSAESPYRKLIRSGCGALDLDASLFRRLIPLYLVIFHDLKKDYARGIQHAVVRAIHGLEGVPDCGHGGYGAAASS